MLEQRYGDKVTTILMAVLNGAANTAVMAGQIMAGKRLFEYIGVNPVLGAIITTLIVIIYSSMSGLWGVMMTDVIQSTVIFITVIVTVIFIGSQGGFQLMAQNLPAESFQMVPFSMETFIMMLGPTALYGLVSSAAFQRTVSCKEEKTAVMAPVIAACMIIPFVVLACTDWNVRKGIVAECGKRNDYFPGTVRGNASRPGRTFNRFHLCCGYVYL